MRLLISLLKKSPLARVLPHPSSLRFLLLLGILLAGGFFFLGSSAYAQLFKPVEDLREEDFCPGDPRGGPSARSELGTESGALREEGECSGVLGSLSCFFNDFLWGELVGPGGDATFLNSALPEYLREANELLLLPNLEISGASFIDKQGLPGGISGSLARLSPPIGGFDNRNDLRTLWRSEAVLSDGLIILNQGDEQTGFSTSGNTDTIGGSGKGSYDSADGDYDVPGRFGEVSPLADRFGLLKEAFFPPSDEAVSISGADCRVYSNEGKVVYYPNAVDVQFLEEPENIFETIWSAAWKIEEFDESKADEETGEVSAQGPTAGNLDTESDVARTRQAWERIGAPPREGDPQSGGVYNILLMPGQEFATKEAELALRYSYDAVKGGGSSGDAQLFLADLGNVEGAVDCIKNGITANPWEANETSCTNAFLGIPPSGGIGGEVEGCFVFSDGAGVQSPDGQVVPWSTDPEAQARVMAAIPVVLRSPNYTHLVCKDGPINLYRVRVASYNGGRARSSERAIFINGTGTGVYTLAHETGHIVDYWNGLFTDFMAEVGPPNRESFIETYPFTKTEHEDFAETAAVYIARNVLPNYAAKYPRHYNFARSRLFGGVEY